MEKFQISRVRQPEQAPRGLRRIFPGLFLKERDIWNGTGTLLLFLLLYAGRCLFPCILFPCLSDLCQQAESVQALYCASESLSTQLEMPGPS